MDNPGYHLKEIPKGKLGDFSKIEEEFLEFKDAHEQKVAIMELIELSDLYGAIESYLENNFGLSIKDLEKFSEITKRAFKNGHRS